MERILAGTAHTLVITFTVDGVPAEPVPAGATVEVVRSDDETVLVPAGTAATDMAGTGVYGHTLEPAETVPRGDLVVRWTATLDGDEQTLETLAEIVTSQAVRARERVAELCDSAAAPELTTDELWDLVRAARCSDTEGVAPSDPEWFETYDLNAAAAEGWRRKAGKAAPLYSFSIDGQRSDQSHLYQHCLSQAEHYAALMSSFVRIK